LSSVGLSGAATDVRCFTKQGRFLYAGTFGFGIYQSSDTGQTWFSMNNGLPNNLRVLGVVTSPNTGKIFLKTQTSGQFVSTDSANTWTAINNIPAGMSMDGYLIDLVNDTLFVGCGDVLLKSSDYGQTYRKVEGYPYPNTPMALLKFQNHIYIASSGKGVLRMHKDSLIVHNFEGSGLAAKSALSITNHKGNLFAGTVSASGPNNIQGNGTGGGVYRYYSAEKTWKQRNYGFYASCLISFVSANGNRVFASTGYAGGGVNGLFSTDDNGRNWSQVNVPFLPTGDVVRQGNDLFVPFGTSGIGKSTDGGASFIAITNGLNQVQVNHLLVSGNTIFASAYGGGTYRSSNGGTSWQNCNIGQPTNAGCYGMGKLGNTLFVGINGVPNTIYKSTNNGNSWTEVANTSWESARSFHTMGTYLYAITANGLKRSNDGINWTALASPFFGNYPEKINSDPEGMLFYSTASHFSVSLDSGNTWQEGIGDQVNDSPRQFVISNGRIFAGTGFQGIIVRNTSDFSTTQTEKVWHNSEKLNLFPNPASDQFQIQWKENQKPVAIHLFDLNGSLLRSWKAGDVLSVSDLHRGFYLVKIETETGTLVQKLGLD
jgi:photosystem II stability/assembly factor-like uncharacterized protein